MNDLRQLIYDLWKIDKPVKEYKQNQFLSYQISLNKEESSLIKSQLLASHNPVLRRFLIHAIE